MGSFPHPFQEDFAAISPSGGLLEQWFVISFASVIWATPGFLPPRDNAISRFSSSVGPCILMCDPLASAAYISSPVNPRIFNSSEAATVLLGSPWHFAQYCSNARAPAAVCANADFPPGAKIAVTPAKIIKIRFVTSMSPIPGFQCSFQAAPQYTSDRLYTQCGKKSPVSRNARLNFGLAKVPKQQSRSDLLNAQSLTLRAQRSIHEVTEFQVFLGRDTADCEGKYLRREQNVSVERIFDLQFPKFRFDRGFVRHAIDPHPWRQLDAVLPFLAEGSTQVQRQNARVWAHFRNGHPGQEKRLEEPAITAGRRGEISRE